MIEKIKNNVKNHKFEYICIIAIFIFMLIINSLAPITGDDWGNAAPKFSLISAIESSINYYKTLEGRFIGRILINLMASRKIIYNVLTSLIMASIVYFAYKLIDNKKKQRYPLILFIVSMLLVNRHTFGQSYIWIAGGVTYLYPTAIVLGITAHLLNKKESKFNILESIILIILSLIGTCFVENIGVALVCTWIFFNIYNYIINKKIQFVPIFCLICSTATLVIMLVSPGSAMRLMQTPEFAELSIIGKVLFNINCCIQCLYTRNVFLILLMLIPINYIINKKIKIKWIKVLIMVVLNAFCLANVIQNIQLMLPIDFNRLQFGEIFILNSKKIAVPFWIIFTLLFLYSIVDTYKDDKRKLISNLIIYLIGASSIFCMFMSPVWGDRISILSTLSLYILSISLISNIIKTKKIGKIDIMEIILIGILIIVCIYYLVVFISVAHTESLRKQEIKQCIENNEEVLYLTKSPILIMQNYNPFDEYFVEVFKMCYGIPEFVEIRFI